MVIAFAVHIMSGFTSQSRAPDQAPVRPKAVMTSSVIRRMPCRSQIARTSGTKLSCCGITSPARSRLDPRRTYKGVITSGLMGGFRLNVEGVVRELKVEPIRAL